MEVKWVHLGSHCLKHRNLKILPKSFFAFVFAFGIDLFTVFCLIFIVLMLGLINGFCILPGPFNCNNLLCSGLTLDFDLGGDNVVVGDLGNSILYCFRNSPNT